MARLSELLAQYPVGSKWFATMQDGDIQIPVVVRDLRQTFGRLDVLIAPVGGTGETWVEATKLGPSMKKEGSADESLEVEIPSI